MLKKLLLLLLILISLPAWADYNPTLLPTLASEASLVIEAQIVKVESNTITLKPIRAFKGKATSTIVVDKFKNWTCASRFAPYAINQRAFYFLVKSKAERFSTLGAANEGEVPLFKGFIYYQTAYLRLDKNPQLYPVYTGRVRGYRYTRSDFVAAIEQLIQQPNLNSYLRGNAQAIADTTKNSVLHRAANEYLETHNF